MLDHRALIFKLTPIYLSLSRLLPMDYKSQLTRHLSHGHMPLFVPMAFQLGLLHQLHQQQAHGDKLLPHSAIKAISNPGDLLALERLLIKSTPFDSANDSEAKASLVEPVSNSPYCMLSCR